MPGTVAMSCASPISSNLVSRTRFTSLICACSASTMSRFQAMVRTFSERIQATAAELNGDCSVSGRLMPRRRSSACTRFLNAVLFSTSALRWRRSSRRSLTSRDGTCDAGTMSRYSSRARVRASTLSVLTFAEAIALTLNGCARTTSNPRASTMPYTYSQTPVDSRTNLASSNRSRKRLSASAVVGTRSFPSSSPSSFRTLA